MENKIKSKGRPTQGGRVVVYDIRKYQSENKIKIKKEKKRKKAETEVTTPLIRIRKDDFTDLTHIPRPTFVTPLFPKVSMDVRSS